MLCVHALKKTAVVLQIDAPFFTDNISNILIFKKSLFFAMSSSYILVHMQNLLSNDDSKCLK